MTSSDDLGLHVELELQATIPSVWVTGAHGLQPAALHACQCHHRHCIMAFVFHGMKHYNSSSTDDLASGITSISIALALDMSQGSLRTRA